MVMYNNLYYIMTEKNDKLECVASYEEIERAKQHAKQIVDINNKVCVVLKPVVKIRPYMDYIVQNIGGELK